MVIKMAIDKFYVVKDNIVQNIILIEEADAVKLNLKRAPINTEFGTVDINWTYLPQENSFLPPPRDILNEWFITRQTRNSLLIESDIYVIPDRWATYNQDEKQAWTVYRQALRDIPQNFIDPNEIVWPSKPVVEQMTYIKPSEPIDPEG